MIAPTWELRKRFDALSEEKQERVRELLESARPQIEFLGGTASVWRQAWEEILERVESAEGEI